MEMVCDYYEDGGVGNMSEWLDNTTAPKVFNRPEFRDMKREGFKLQVWSLPSCARVFLRTSDPQQEGPG